MTKLRFYFAFLALCFVCLQSKVEARQTLDQAFPDATRERVLEILFTVPKKPVAKYFQLIMRYGDDESQLVLTRYFGGHSELARYSLGGISGSDLTGTISNMLHDNPRLSDAEIAAHFSVKKDMLKVDEKQIDALVNDLKRIKISPFLYTGIAVDNVSQFDLWFESSGDSVHYVILGTFNKEKQGRLIQWMLGFRKRLR